MADKRLTTRTLVYPRTRTCPGCRTQDRVQVRYGDLVAFHRGEAAEQCFPYLTSAARRRLTVGWCSRCSDAAAELPPPRTPVHRSSPADASDVDRASERMLTERIDALLPCEAEGCTETDTQAVSAPGPLGLKWVQICVGHREQYRGDRLAARFHGPPATAGDWRLRPMQAGFTVPAPGRRWRDRDWEVIRQGLIPAAMEQRWFWYLDGTLLHAHRSWNGVEIFRANFTRDQQGWAIDRLEVAVDPSGQILWPSGGDDVSPVRISGDFVLLMEAELLLMHS